MNSKPSFLKSTFQTPAYHGAWFAFTGDREANREQIQTYLQSALGDQQGRLTVDEQGPHWRGRVKLAGLSYSHARPAAKDVSSGGGFTLLLYSHSHALGVDLEHQNRVFQLSSDAIAKRYFHPQELHLPFLPLWLKKEAYAKATRLGLAKTIHDETRAITQFLFKTVEKVPLGFSATIALQAKL